MLIAWQEITAQIACVLMDFKETPLQFAEDHCHHQKSKLILATHPHVDPVLLVVLLAQRQAVLAMKVL
jgi:hypothetical protein